MGPTWKNSTITTQRPKVPAPATNNRNMVQPAGAAPTGEPVQRPPEPPAHQPALSVIPQPNPSSNLNVNNLLVGSTSGPLWPPQLRQQHHQLSPAPIPPENPLSELQLMQQVQQQAKQQPPSGPSSASPAANPLLFALLMVMSLVVSLALVALLLLGLNASAAAHKHHHHSGLHPFDK